MDIGATGVRAAVLTPEFVGGAPRVTVKTVAEAPLPPGAVNNGIVVDGSAVTRSLKTLWSKNGLKSRDVILGVSSQQIVVRPLDLPNIPADKMAKALPFQARDVVAIPLDQAVLDFIRTGAPDPETDTVPGLLIAAPREPIAASVSAAERAGLRVRRVDLSSFALLRAIGEPGPVTEMLLDIGAQLTTMTIHQAGMPLMVRTVARGGDELTEKLRTKADWDTNTAEHAKRQVGLSGADANVSGALLDAVRGLVTEVRSSIHVFNSQFPNATIDRIALTGGGSYLTGLPELISSQLTLHTRVVAPLEYLPRSGRAGTDLHGASAVSVGLALGAAA